MGQGTNVTTEANARRPGPGTPVDRGAAGLVLAGAVCTSGSPVFMKLSDATAGTGAVLRCGLALVVLVPLAVREWRRIGPRGLRYQLMDIAAGVLLGLDMVFWAQSVIDVGASVATVLLNIQVVFFPLFALIFSRVRVSTRFVLLVPVMLVGVALASGAIGHAQPGSHPVAGVIYGTTAGIAYAGYLFLMRHSGGRAHTTVPVCWASAAATVAAAVLGTLWTGVDFDIGWAGWGWLSALALFGQVLTWLLITTGLPRLTPSVSGALLLISPVLAFGLGVAIGERPTVTQAAGCVLVVAAVWLNSRTATTAPRTAATAQRSVPDAPRPDR